MDAEQSAPIEEGSDEATEDEVIRGIVQQVRGDVTVGHTRENVATLLHERLVQAGLQLSDEREQQLVEELRSGSD